MAGSFMHYPNQETPDPILTARLDALRLLAAQVAEPIVIFTPTFELVYANDSARRLQAECPLLDPDQSQSLHFSSSTHACPDCPGKSVFSQDFPGSLKQEIDVEGTPLPPPVNCPFPQAFPLLGSKEASGCVLMMGRNGKESFIAPMVGQKEGIPETLPATQNLGGPGAIEGLIGNSSVMEQVAEMIQVVAGSRASVLVQGESGTGKEVVARSIHRLSFRRDRPFVVVDCGSLPETLLESELFGHLLRVLQEGEVKPVGSNRSRKVDVRIISASNKPLEELVKQKAFRGDLYYRLAVLPIHLSPLRDRREDIPLLIEHFTSQACVKNGRSRLAVDPEVSQILMERSWPGNVRELEHLIERIVVTSRGSRLTRVDVDKSGQSTLGNDLPTTGRMARAGAEKLRILHALAQAKGNKTQAAQVLNISRASLYNKLRDYHIS
jgi:two-component system response regulator AtoC